MAAISTVQKIAVSLKLNNGLNPETGTQKTVSISLGSLNKDAWDADKAMAIVNTLAPCLEKSLMSVIKTETTTLADD